MKRIMIVLLSLVVVSAAAHSSYAEDVFPEFTTSTATIYLPYHTYQGYQEDPDHEEGLNVRYTLENSQLFTEPATRHIQTLAEGFSGTTDRGTPWKTLTELLAAYQQGDIQAVRNLFTPESQGEIDAMLADTDMQQQYLEFMQAIESVDVLLGFEHKNGFLAMIEVRPEGMDSHVKVAPTPVYFVQAGGQYLLSAVTLDEAVDANITAFLQQDHTVEDLLNPPLPEYTLSVEKSGSGSGIVDGGGVDCGDDCLEVYQEGMLVFLQAEPDEESDFTGWLIDGNPLQGRIEMTQDITVTAIFTKKP